MNSKEAHAVRALARAQNQDARMRALNDLRYSATRVEPEFTAEIDALLAESRSVCENGRRLQWGQRNNEENGLRQVLRPSQRKPGVLTDLDPQDDPIGLDALLAPVEEWCLAWQKADKLAEAGADLPGPLILHGPPGTGKTHMTAAIARRLPDYPAGVIDAHNIVTSYVGATGSSLAKAFEACATPPAMLVIEEVDAFGLSRSDGDSGASVENSRVTIALMRLLDQHEAPVILTTNRFDLLDPALIRRCEIVVKFPEPRPAQLLRIAALHLGVDVATLSPETLNGSTIREIVPAAKRARRAGILRDADPVMEFARILADSTFDIPHGRENHGGEKHGTLA